jgi:hypothetical protein
VHYLLALQLQTSDEAIEDAQILDDLGLNPLDLVLFVLRLEEFAATSVQLGGMIMFDGRTPDVCCRVTHENHRE